MSNDETLSTLALPDPAIAPGTSAETAFAIFHEDHRRRALVVADRGVPVGLVERLSLIERFAQPYGRSLYGRRPVAQIMNSQPLILDEHLNIAAAAIRLTADGEPELMQSFIITRNGLYLGLGRVRDLLSRLTDMQLRHARHANPLTGLPGNVPLTQHIDHCLRSGIAVTVAYFDCNDFKPYNDVYGYAAGDRVIRELGALLEQHTAAGEDFVGHIGGDDFMVVFESLDWEARCQQILSAFATAVPAFYTQRDLLQGGIESRDRNGELRFFPLLSVAVGVCQPDPQYCHSHLDVANLAADAKHTAKQPGGNTLFLSRRRRPVITAASEVSGFSEEQAERY